MPWTMKVVSSVRRMLTPGSPPPLAWVAADLAVVGRLAAVLAHGVEERQRAAARADHETEIPVELGHVARHTAVVLGVDLLAGDLERRRLARLAGLLLADAEVVQQ